MISTPIPHGQPQASRVFRERVKDILTAVGHARDYLILATQREHAGAGGH